MAWERKLWFSDVLTTLLPHPTATHLIFGAVDVLNGKCHYLRVNVRDEIVSEASRSGVKGIVGYDYLYWTHLNYCFFPLF